MNEISIKRNEGRAWTYAAVRRHGPHDVELRVESGAYIGDNDSVCASIYLSAKDAEFFAAAIQRIAKCAQKEAD